MKLITALIALAFCLLTGEVLAWGGNYLSDYSHGGNGYYLSGYNTGSGSSTYLSGYGTISGGHYGNSGGYVSIYTGDAGHIDKRHNREYEQLAQQKKLEQKRHQFYNSHPPCGIYGRVPEYCKVGAQVAPQ